MPLILSLIFVALAVASGFVQAKGSALRKWVSPGLTAFCGLSIAYGVLAQSVPVLQGLTLFIALALLATSDFMFERSEEKPGLFPLAMVFGVVSGFTIGILFNLAAARAGVPALILAGCFLVGASMAALVYRYLQVEPALKIAVYIYLVQAVILLAGGLACLYAGLYPFAVWGILLFFSDSLVGMRAFPNPGRRIAWLGPERILPAILVIYYTAQFALVSWALQLQ